MEGLRSNILQRLPHFENNYVVIVDEQSVPDIMDAMKSFHEKYAEDYDKIADLFLAASPMQTLKKLFLFLKENVRYVKESEAKQTVRSPAAIVATGKNIGLDCKNYALFIGGIIDSLNRQGLASIPFVYRYASYSMFDKTPAHVFIVAYPNTDHEIWIDPVLKTFNARNPRPTFYKDKKFSRMLYGINGVQKVGAFGVDDALVILPTLLDLFGGGNRPNPNDWQGWDALYAKLGGRPGQGAAEWVIKDGDSVPNEAANIWSYITKVPNGLQNVVNNGGVSIQQIANKLQRGGLSNEAQSLIEQTSPKTLSKTTVDQNGNLQQPRNNNMLLLLGGAAVLFFLMKRR